MWHLFLQKRGREGGRKRGREERRRSSTSGRKRGPPINIHLMHSYSRASGSLRPAAAFVLAGSSPRRRPCTQIPLVTQQPQVHNFTTLSDSSVIIALKTAGVRPGFMSLWASFMLLYLHKLGNLLAWQTSRPVLSGKLTQASWKTLTSLIFESITIYHHTSVTIPKHQLHVCLDVLHLHKDCGLEDWHQFRS